MIVYSSEAHSRAYEIAHQITNLYEKQRIKAQELGNIIDTDLLNILIETSKQMNTYLKRWRLRLGFTIIGGIWVMPLLMFEFLPLLRLLLSGYAIFSCIALVLTSFIPLDRIICLSSKGREYCLIIRALAYTSDQSAINVLIESMDIVDKDTQSIVSEALIRMLPHTSDASIYTLTTEQQKRLLQIIDYSYGIGKFNKNLALKHFDLALSSIIALSHLGNEQTLKRLEQIKRRSYTTNEQLQIHEMIEAVVPTMTFRLQQLSNPQILLRESQSPATNLLRSVSAQDSTPTDQLLRPAENDETPPSA